MFFSQAADHTVVGFRRLARREAVICKGSWILPASDFEKFTEYGEE